MTFIGKFFASFQKLFRAAPSWTHVAQTIVNFAAPVAEAVIALDAPELAPVANAIIGEVKTDLATIHVLAGEGTVTPSLTGAISRVQDNLGSLLAIGHIKDVKLTANINLVVGELQALAGMLPTDTAGVAPAPATA